MRLFEGTPFDRPPRCEQCGELEADCTCPPPPEPRTAPERQSVKVATERRKGGRTVTTLRGMADEGTHLADALSQLKTRCGAGGAVKEGVLELQGDQRESASAWLREQGYRVRS